MLSAGFFGFILALACLAEAADPPTDFTFLQVSDLHVPIETSPATIARIPKIGPMNLVPYGVEVGPPEFVLATGDLTEFGGGQGWWKEYLSLWEGCALPVHPVLGNHDNTWHANVRQLRALGLAPSYAFDQHGCHFIGLNTATLQDPRPSIGEEALHWLKADLEAVSPATPVFVFFHHPLGGKEFASRYDYDRLLDVLSGHNVVLLLAGHYHNYASLPLRGFDQITGGSTFGPNAGLGVISVKGGTLRAAYWKNGEPAPAHPVLEKPLPKRSPRPAVELVTPAFRQSVSNTLDIAARLTGAGGITKATWTIDDDLEGALKLEGAGTSWTASGQAALSSLLPGAHYLRVEFVAGEQQHSRSTAFFLDPPGGRVAWRAYLGASSKSTPTVAGGTVYVGADDGQLHAFNAQTGARRWSVATGAEILVSPLVVGDTVYAANGLGVVMAFTKAGKKRWAFTLEDAVYSSPVFVEGKVVFGCNDGHLYAVHATTGKLAWKTAKPAYTIESKPFVWRGNIYFGAWDETVRCVDARTGKQLWERPGEGSRLATAAKRYYSPADAMPVVAEGRLFVADRRYHLALFDARTGLPGLTYKGVSALGLSENSRCVYLRQSDGNLTKATSEGKTLWSTPAKMGNIPTIPTEKDGVVYVCNGLGLASALAADTGKILWQHQVSPKLFVMSSMACDGVRAYVTAFDGSLTALKCR